MNDKYFIDTNIFVYAFDRENAEKHRKSNELIKHALKTNTGCISFQVIQEFINVSTRKFVVPFTAQDCEKYMSSILVPLCQVFVSIELYTQAFDIINRWKFSFYDSLIVAAALQAECSILYSEDLQHEQKIGPLAIRNPFL